MLSVLFVTNGLIFGIWVTRYQATTLGVVMPMFDMSKVLDSAMYKESFEGIQQNTMATAVFSTKVSGVAQEGVQLYIATVEACEKAVTSSPPSMTKEAASFAVDCAKQLMVAKTGYAVAYFKQ